MGGHVPIVVSCGAFHSFVRSHPLDPVVPTLIRGEVLTLEPGQPVSEALLVDGGTVVATGSEAERRGRGAALLELAAGEMAVPGFVDEHLHLLSMAAQRLSVDAALPSIDEVLSAVADAAADAAPRAWVRAVGFDDAFVAERRVPDRTELDEATGETPAVLHHRTGHLAVVNSAALKALGLSPDSDGVLVDRQDVLARVPPLPAEELADALVGTFAALRAAGIVAVTDATHTNDHAALALLDQQDTVEVTAMVGWDRLDGLSHGETVGRVEVGPAKIMPATGGVLSRSGRRPALAEAVASAHRAGFPVAVHVMEIDVLAETLDALEGSPPPEGTRDRIEHCSLALPEQLARLGELPVEVVTQPSFVTRRGQKYREELTETELQWLWPVASVLACGIPLRFSSDAPVVPARPVEWMAAATRRSISPAERISIDEAVRAASSGSLRPGRPARVVVVDRDLSREARVLLG